MENTIDKIDLEIKKTKEYIRRLKRKKEDLIDAINSAKIRKQPFEKPVIITFLWNDRMDVSNHSYMAKLIEERVGVKAYVVENPELAVATGAGTAKMYVKEPVNSR